MTQTPGKPPTRSSSNKNRRNNKLEAYLIAGEARFKPKVNNTIIDLEQIYSMASIGCTYKEMAALLKCSVDWIMREVADNPDFALAIAQGQADMKRSLRRTQLEVALNGNPAMLIWLGKQMLDQRDKQDVSTTHTEVNVLVTACMQDLDKIDKQALLDARQALRNGLTIDQTGADVADGGGVGDRGNNLSNADDGGGGPPV